MADKWKNTFIFENGDNGWSETYYSDAPNLASNQTLVDTLAALRIPLLAFPARIKSSRSTNLSTPPGKDIQKYPAQNGTYATQADLPWTAWLAQPNAAAEGRSTNIYMRGIPDAVFDRQGLSNSTDYTNFVNRFKTFRQQLIQGPWYIRGRPRKKTGTRYAISTMAASTVQSRTTIAFGGALPPVAEGDYITIYGIPSLNPAPGQVVVREVNTVAVDISVGYTTPPNYVYPGGGFMIIATPQFAKITAVPYSDVTKRNIGRPSGAHRGRRKKNPR